jgi:hypothetical protein
VRPPGIALLLAVLLASCGGDAAPRPVRAASIGDYAATTNTLCSQLASAVRRTFRDAPSDPVAALSRYARDVHDAGERFSQATPPAVLRSFHAAAVRHLARESAVLRHAADLSAAGDPAGALDALHLVGLLPDPIPGPVLRRAPACRGASLPPTHADPAAQLA